MQIKSKVFLLITISFFSFINIYCADKPQNQQQQKDQQEPLDEEKELLKKKKEWYASGIKKNEAEIERENLKISDGQAIKSASIQTFSQITINKFDALLTYGWNWAWGIQAEIDAEIKEKKQNESKLNALNIEKTEAEKKLTEARLINEEISTLVTASSSGLLPRDECKQKIKTLQVQKNKLLGIPEPEEKPPVDTPQEKPILDTPPKPGRIKRIANFVTEKSIIAADGIASTLPINSHLDELTKTEQFKNSWVDTYKTELSRAAALGLVATTLAILYKSYSWYTNEDRRLACDAIVQLEEQKEQIALQFAKEMNKPTVSAEDKAKLQIAYNNYMQDLQVEIDEQRAIAGYNIPKKLLIGAGIAATGIAGIIAFTKYRVDITDMITLAKNYFSDQSVASNSIPNNAPETTHHTIIDTAPEPEQQKENTNNHTANDNSKLEKDSPKLRLKGHP